MTSPVRRMTGALVVAVLLAGCAGPPDDVSEPSAAAGTTPTSVVLNPAPDTSTAQTVTWRTAKPWKGQRVEARPMDGGAAVTATARRKAATTVEKSGSARPAWTATLTGLQPGTTYRYRVVHDAGRSTDHTFTTGAATLEPWTFLALGDTQVDNAGPPAAIIDAAVDAHPDAGLVLHAGDVVNLPWKHQEWADLMTALRPARTSRNVAVSIGNHEQCILLKDCRSGGAQGFRAYFTGASNGVADQYPTWYRFDRQGVRFVVLDAFRDDLATQARFLDRELAANPQRWSVVLLHAGPFASREKRTNTAVFSRILPVLEKHDVDLVLSGHDHVYSRGYHGDPDGTVFAASDSGPKFYVADDADWVRRDATRVRWRQQVSTYQVVDVDRDTLRYRAVAAYAGRAPTPGRYRAGDVVDDVTITKDSSGAKSVTW